MKAFTARCSKNGSVKVVKRNFLLRSVIELRPKSIDRMEVVSLFRDGSYSAALRASRGRDDGRTRAVRARALLRLERTEEALREVSAPTDDLSMDLRGEHASLASIALVSAGRFTEAHEFQRDARAYLFSVDEPALETELHAFEAKLAFAEGDFDRARRISERALETGDRFARRSDVVCASTARADVLNVLAVLQVTLGNRTRAIEYLLEALTVLDSSPIVDVGLTAKLLSNITANLDGIDLDLERSSVALVRDRHSAISWTPDLVTYNYLIVRELGWASALGGNHLSAFREFRTAFNLAPSSKYRLRALLDRVFLSRELDQHVSAHVDLLEAQELTMSIDWAQASEGETASLLTFATLIASLDLAAARGALRTYMAKKATAIRTSTTFTDERYYGEVLQAEAAIAYAEGRVDAANSLTAKAFEIYDRLGIRWRAAHVALDLVTSADAVRYAGYVRAEALRRPNSWLALRVASA